MSEDVFAVIFRLLATLPEKVEKLQMEELKTSVAYRDLAKTLEKEGYKEYAEKLREIASTEEKHAEFFKKLKEAVIRR
jgi:rubrerythrin